MALAFFIAAACSSLYDTDKLTDSEETTDDGDGLDGTDAALEDPDGGGGSDSGAPSDAAVDEPDAAAECGAAGQSCNEDDPFFECNVEGECAECGRTLMDPCCETAPRCDGSILGGLVICTESGICLL